MDTYCCVLFIDDFKYDVINVKHIERSQVSKSKSSQMEKGEVVKASGYVAKIMRIGKIQSAHTVTV